MSPFTNLDFTVRTLPSRVVFGAGASGRLAELMDELGVSRALVLSTSHQADGAGRLAASLGAKAVGTFAEAAMHTPTDVSERATARARELGADCTIALGGGSTTGLGKAIAWRTDLLQIVVPTTYAGSEVTPILGQTENGEKTTLKDPKVLPEAVVYDPELTVSLPVGMTVTSGLNAMAHAVEALYATDRQPIATLMAAEGLRAMHRALPAVVAAPEDPDARADALYGAWLCGHVLGAVGMALHHKLCHTLGGSFDLPHAETHAILLPHTAAYNARAVPELLAPLARTLDDDVGPGLHAFARRLGAPLALADIGFDESGIERAATLAAARPYPNPADVTEEGIRALLGRALRGDPPE